MNKPATKEPSMDEILSSIRQIIADDEAVPPPSPARPAKSSESSDALPAFDSFRPEDEDAEGGETDDAASEGEARLSEDDDADDEALALSPEQIVEKGEGGDRREGRSTFGLASQVAIPDDVAFDLDGMDGADKPRVSASEAAPMPDPNLSADMAERLLRPTADAAVRSTFARLGSAALGGQDLTIEKMIREMLRPMLKEWLDENLPAMVERMVEREIERISRGGL